LSNTREEIERKELEKVLTPALISKLELLRQMEEVAQAGESEKYMSYLFCQNQRWLIYVETLLRLMMCTE
jgi:hypothetical protein